MIKALKFFADRTPQVGGKADHEPFRRKAGWYVVRNGRRVVQHYVKKDQGRSLCGRSMNFVPHSGYVDDNCRKCVELWEKI